MYEINLMFIYLKIVLLIIFGLSISGACIYYILKK